MVISITAVPRGCRYRTFSCVNSPPCFCSYLLPVSDCSGGGRRFYRYRGVSRSTIVAPTQETACGSQVLREKKKTEIETRDKTGSVILSEFIFLLILIE